MLIDGDADAYACAASGFRVDVEGAADGLGALSHGVKPESGPARDLEPGGIEAVAVVGDADGKTAVDAVHIDFDAACLRVFSNVCERLLNDPHQLHFCGGGEVRVQGIFG